MVPIYILDDLYLHDVITLHGKYINLPLDYCGWWTLDCESVPSGGRALSRFKPADGHVLTFMNGVQIKRHGMHKRRAAFRRSVIKRRS